MITETGRHPRSHRLPPRPKRPVAQTVQTSLFLVSGAMLGFATPNLVSGDGFDLYAKAGLLAVGGTAVAYGVNKLAVDKGAPLAVIGYAGAGLASLLSSTIVGGGLFAATYAGLTKNDVEDLRLNNHGSAVVEYVSTQTAYSDQTARVLPAVNAVVSDLGQKATCEYQSSCLSGRGNGGQGPVFRALQEQLGLAQSVAGQLEAGDDDRTRSVAKLSALLGEYQKLLGDQDLSADKRRMALQAIDAEIRQTASHLKEAIPTTFVSSYASKLSAGADIEGRLAASRTLSSILNGHGNSIAGVLASVPDVPEALPPFPQKAGVSDTFAYIGHFIPIAVLAFVVEFIFPVAMWLYAYWTLSWKMHRREPASPRAYLNEDPFHGLLDDEPGFSRDGISHEQEDLPERPVSRSTVEKTSGRGRKARRAHATRLNGSSPDPSSTDRSDRNSDGSDGSSRFHR